MDEDIRRLADPDLLAECARVGAAVEVLAERYRALGAEFTRRAAGTAGGEIVSFPVPVARLLAVDMLLADPESLGDDVLESCLYLLQEKLRTDWPVSPLRVAITAG